MLKKLKNKTVLGFISVGLGLYGFGGVMGYLPLLFFPGVAVAVLAIITGAMSLYKNTSTNNLRFLGVIGILTGLFVLGLFLYLSPFLFLEG